MKIVLTVMFCKCYWLTPVLSKNLVRIKCNCLLHYCVKWLSSYTCGEATSNANTSEIMMECRQLFLTSLNVLNITFVFID